MRKAFSNWFLTETMKDDFECAHGEFIGNREHAVA